MDEIIAEIKRCIKNLESMTMGFDVEEAFAIEIKLQTYESILELLEDNKPVEKGKPDELGYWYAYGVFQKGYIITEVFIPEGISGQGLAVKMLDWCNGWYNLDVFIEKYAVTKWIKVGENETN